MLNLPRVYVITGENPRDKNEFLRKLKRCLDEGYRLIQFRAPQVTIDEYENLAKEAIKISNSYSAKIILNKFVDLVDQIDANGVHLPSSMLMSISNRPLPGHKLVSASCHTEEQLRHAQRLKVDFVTLSPVALTKTHPEALPLGWNKFRELCSVTQLPVYALGGMRLSDISISLASGGYGIAAISSIWR